MNSLSVDDFGRLFISDLSFSKRLHVGMLFHYPNEMPLGASKILLPPEIVSATPGRTCWLNYSKADAFALGSLLYGLFVSNNPLENLSNYPCTIDEDLKSMESIGCFLKPSIEIQRIAFGLLKHDFSRRMSVDQLIERLESVLFAAPVEIVDDNEALKGWIYSRCRSLLEKNLVTLEIEDHLLIEYLNFMIQLHSIPIDEIDKPDIIPTNYTPPSITPTTLPPISIEVSNTIKNKTIQTIVKNEPIRSISNPTLPRSTNSLKSVVEHSSGAKLVKTQSVLVNIPHRTYTYEELLQRPSEANCTMLEYYLTDEEFNRIFQMTRDEYLQIPKWKRDLKKKQVNLF